MIIETAPLCSIAQDDDYQEVTLTLVHPEDFTAKSVQELRLRKLKRMLREAEEQGGRLTPKLLAQLLCCDIATVYKELKVIKTDLRRRVRTIIGCIFEIEPFKSSNSMRETLIFLVDRYYSRKRNHGYRSISNAENVIITIAYLLCGSEKLENKTKKHIIKRILEEFKAEGIYLPYPSLSGFKKCILKVSEILKIPKNIKTEILKDVEMKYRFFNAKLPFGAFIAAIIHEKCLQYDFKVELNKISTLFGISTEIVSLAGKEFRHVKPERSSAAEKHGIKLKTTEYSQKLLNVTENKRTTRKSSEMIGGLDIDLRRIKPKEERC